MQQLDALTREARSLANGLPVTVAETEVARQLQICNACRYCEGFCAVFPAMTRRLEFGKADVHYLANLCHNCSACLYACQYAPPHEFAVTLPQALAVVRGQTYAEYAWPAALGALYKRNGLTVALAAAFGLALFLVLLLAARGSLLHAPMAGNFYAVFAHNTLALIFGAVFGFALLALGMGVARFWRTQTPVRTAAVRTEPVEDPASASTGSVRTGLEGAAAEAVKSALTLKYLDGGHGQGCNETGDAFTLLRRRFHHLTFYGFMLCFAATCVATLYHYLLGLQAPYALTSLPVLLGTAGGIGLLVGPAGLLWLNLRRNPAQVDARQKPMDRGFIALLFFTSLTGLALLAWRDSGAMALLLAIHLGFVMALFLTLPYGKFAHGVYRSAALLKYAIEKRQPNELRCGTDL